MRPYSGSIFFLSVGVAVGIAGLAGRASAQSVPIDHDAIRATRILTAVRVNNESISVDGHLNEPAWQEAPVATDFIQKFPNNGAPSTERTVVRILYDDHNLYVGFWCYDSTPSKLLIRISRRISSSGRPI